MKGASLVISRPRSARCIAVLLMVVTTALAPRMARGAFVRDDSFDYRGVHMIKVTGAVGPSSTIAMSIGPIADWGTFKVSLQTGQLTDDQYIEDFVYIDYNNDGVWDFSNSFNCPSACQTQGTFTLPPPPTGPQTVRVKMHFVKPGFPAEEHEVTRDVPITVLPPPRVYKDESSPSRGQSKPSSVNSIPTCRCSSGPATFRCSPTCATTSSSDRSTAWTARARTA